MTKYGKLAVALEVSPVTKVVIHQYEKFTDFTTPVSTIKALMNATKVTVTDESHNDAPLSPVFLKILKDEDLVMGYVHDYPDLKDLMFVGAYSKNASRINELRRSAEREPDEYDVVNVAGVGKMVRVWWD